MHQKMFKLVTIENLVEPNQQFQCGFNIAKQNYLPKIKFCVHVDTNVL